MEKPATLHKLEELYKQEELHEKQAELDDKIDTAFKLRNVLAEQAGMEVVTFDVGGYDEG